jgi:hypothetical protein
VAGLADGFLEGRWGVFHRFYAAILVLGGGVAGDPGAWSDSTAMVAGSFENPKPFVG